jgi:hypothetical protein
MPAPVRVTKRWMPRKILLALAWCVGCGPAAREHPAALPAAPQPAASQVLPAPTPAPEAESTFTESAEPDQLAPGLTLGEKEGSHEFCFGLLEQAEQAATTQDCARPAEAQALLVEAMRDDAHRVQQALRNGQDTCELESLSGATFAEYATYVSASRDTSLAPLEACAGFAPGLIRALRADLAPECAEALAEDALKRRLTRQPRWQHALYGVVFAQRMREHEFAAPAFTAKGVQPGRAEDYFQKIYLPWLAEQEKELAVSGALIDALPAESYGGALARAAGGATWRRLLRASRQMSIPEAWKRSGQARVGFYTRLEALRQPLLARAEQAIAEGRAALETLGFVSSTELVRLGDLVDERELLRRVLLPLPESPELASDAALLAAALPPFFTTELLSVRALRNVETLRAAALRGLSPAARQGLTEHAGRPEVDAIVARVNLIVALGSASKQRARRALLLAKRSLASAPAASTELVHAVAQALEGDLGALETLSEREGVIGKLAALDRHGLRLLAVPMPAYEPAPARLEADPLSPECHQHAIGEYPEFVVSSESQRASCLCPYRWWP